jgi:leucyl aminopeptidase (aminopeptidase T)
MADLSQGAANAVKVCMAVGPEDTVLIVTNIGLQKLSGNLLQDEKIPGVHVAFGHPYPEETGADWDCPSHCDGVATRSTVKVDGQYLMRDGAFVI